MKIKEGETIVFTCRACKQMVYASNKKGKIKCPNKYCKATFETEKLLEGDYDNKNEDYNH